MNEQQRQTRELLELEIQLARLKVRAEHIRLRQLKQQRQTRRANLVRTAELLAAAFADSRSSRTARPCAACGPSPGSPGTGCATKTAAAEGKPVFRRPETFTEPQVLPNPFSGRLKTQLRRNRNPISVKARFPSFPRRRESCLNRGNFCQNNLLPESD